MRLLTISFDTTIRPWEVPAFRGAVARHVGFDHDLYHNHNNANGLDTPEYLHRYPLIQYKQHRGHPMLICLEAGVEALQHFFAQPNFTLDMGPLSRPMRVARLDMRHHDFDSRNEVCRYHLRDWLALNEDNYAAYQQCNGLLDQVALLERILQNQLVALCYAFGHAPPDALEVRIQDLRERRWADYKDLKLWCFSLEFTARINLPNFLGIGKGASTGWGILRKLRIENL